MARNRSTLDAEIKRTLTQARKKTAPNVLFLTIDALRRDRCLKVMHRFQKWAKKEAVFFANHYSVAHCSDPNYLSMLSGVHPDNHGVYSQIKQDEEDQSWDGYPAYGSIWFWLKAIYGHKVSGYTATFPKFYWHGFDEVMPMGRNVKTTGEWLMPKDFMKRVGEPWGFFVRTMDCHQPYMKYDRRKKKHVPCRYNHSVRWTDEITADLINYVLKEYPNTLIIFCSDHGELLGEHGVKEHFSTLYQQLLRIPMYMYWPGCPGGMVVEEFTQHIDIFPTVLDLFSVEGEMKEKAMAYMDGLPMTMAMDGKELRPFMTFVAEGVLADAYRQHRAIIDWPWKYIVEAHIKEGPRFELYNLEEDPNEKRNLAREQPDRLMRLAYTIATSWPYGTQQPRFWDRVVRYVRPDTVGQWEKRYREAMGVTEEEADKIMERLRALGYAG